MHPILIIVESPSKCKKIEQLLGSEYRCVATFGHLRTIPSLKHIDTLNQYAPTYEIIPEKEKHVERIRKEIKQAREVFLSSDLDREGEMISYSVLQLFNLPLTTKRITFTEITEPALRYAVAHPRTIDMNVVHAQQARQILDLLVGHTISPALWKWIVMPKGKDHALSAGRCQTPALKLVYENEQAIRQCTPTTMYRVTASFTSRAIPFELNQSLASEEEARSFCHASQHFAHHLKDQRETEMTRSPPAPFTTSRIQQVASNVYRYSPKETMRLCQTLYEAGYITYMRTDSQKYSHEFVQQVGKYLNQHLASCHWNSLMETATASQTEAHEAIRPTDIFLREIPETVGKKEQKMYTLIWRNALQSCMTPARGTRIVTTVTAPFDYEYRHTEEEYSSVGWLWADPSFSPSKQMHLYLKSIVATTPLPCQQISAKVSIQGGVLHYTEAKLVQLLEEKGIGRPSTYASLVDKIQERGYVAKQHIQGQERTCTEFEVSQHTLVEKTVARCFGEEKDKLVIQPLGVMVMDFLNQHFQPLFDYGYTASMETQLDCIAKGTMEWHRLCYDCHRQLETHISRLTPQDRATWVIDDEHTVIVGKHGPVVKKVDTSTQEVTFLPLQPNVDWDKLRQGTSTLEEVVQTPEREKTDGRILGTFQEQEVIVRKGKFGLYATWGTQRRHLREFGNRPLENITMSELQPLLEESNTLLREVTQYMSVRKGPKGNYLFYKKGKMKKPSFHSLQSFSKETGQDYLTCPESELLAWVHKTYGIQ